MVSFLAVAVFSWLYLLSTMWHIDKVNKRLVKIWSVWELKSQMFPLLLAETTKGEQILGINAR